MISLVKRYGSYNPDGAELENLLRRPVRTGCYRIIFAIVPSLRIN